MALLSQSKVCFFFKTTVSLQDRTKLKKFIEAIFRKEKSQLCSLNYIFCNDKYLLEINRQYLKHDYYTDIITFELSQNKMPIEGEVYISIDRVKDNARLLHQPFYMELHRVIFHGTLHLCGYRDMNKKQSKEMREMETKCLNEYF